MLSDNSGKATQSIPVDGFASSSDKRSSGEIKFDISHWVSLIVGVPRRGGQLI